MKISRRDAVLAMALSAIVITQIVEFHIITTQTAYLTEEFSKKLDRGILAIVDLISQNLTRQISSSDHQFPVYPEMNVTPYKVNIEEDFAEFRYDMPCMWTLVVSEFSVNESMTSLEVHEAVLSHYKNLEFMGFEIIRGHVALVYGKIEKDPVTGKMLIHNPTYAWYCNASKILFLIESTAATEEQKRVLKNIVGSICH